MEEGSLFQRMKQIFHEDEMDEEMQKEAAELIRNIFRYMDKDAKDIMTHRKNIVAIDGDRKSTRLNSSHTLASRMPSSA